MLANVNNNNAMMSDDDSAPATPRTPGAAYHDHYDDDINNRRERSPDIAPIEDDDDAYFAPPAAGAFANTGGAGATAVFMPLDYDPHAYISEDEEQYDEAPAVLRSSSPPRPRRAPPKPESRRPRALSPGSPPSHLLRRRVRRRHCHRPHLLLRAPPRAESLCLRASPPGTRSAPPPQPPT
jgi:hypothetical protein